MSSFGNNEKWDITKDRTLSQIIQQARLPLCISDPQSQDNPVVFANAAFFELTGFSPEEFLGKNCRLLQGPGTDLAAIEKIRNIIRDRTVGTVEILNYRKDGTAFLNCLQVGPIFDDKGKLIFYFGSQLDVSIKRHLEQQARDLADRELLHRLKNITNVMSAMIFMTAKEEKNADEFARKVAGRLLSLSEAHFNTILRSENSIVSMVDLARSIILPYAPSGERQFRISGSEVELSKKLVSPVALALHELATNAVKYGAFSLEKGIVEVELEDECLEDSNRLSIKWQEINGPVVIPPQRQSGSDIVRTLIRSSGGDIQFDWQRTGLVVKIEFQSGIINSF